MCGIVGLIARRPAGFDYGSVDMFEELLLIDQLRGDDSTGVFGVDKKRNVGVLKVASHPKHLFACPEWQKFRQHSYQNGMIMIGHNRAATKGEVKTANAHPFHENNIVLVHNGTLRGDHKKDHADRDVDSHALCAAFNEKGAEEVIPTINGAFALVWYDLAAGKLCISRNDERPLNILTTDDAYIICSEAWMGHAVASRKNRKVTDQAEFEPGFIYELGRDREFVAKKLTSSKQQASVGGQQSGTHGSGNTTTTHGPASKIKQCSLVKGGASNDDVPDNVKRLPFVTDESKTPFQKQERVLVYLTEGRVEPNAKENNDPKPFLRLTGKTMEPGRPVIDVVVYTQYKEGSNQMGQLIGKPVLVKMNGFHNSTCGWTGFCTEPELPAQVEVWNQSITIREWTHVVDNCKCSMCSAHIRDLEAPITNVIEDEQGKYVVMCCDCVEDMLTKKGKKDAKEDFLERRDRALQVGEHERKEPPASTDRRIQIPGSPSVH